MTQDAKLKELEDIFARIRWLSDNKQALAQRLHNHPVITERLDMTLNNLRIEFMSKLESIFMEQQKHGSVVE